MAITPKHEIPKVAFAQKRNLLLHPLTITSVLWGTLMIFYALHFSNLLLFSTPELLPVTLAIWIPFGLVALGSFLWRPRALRRRYRLLLPSPAQLVTIEKRLRSLWYLWLVLAVFETAFSGGFPIVWAFTNPSKTYFDYGVPSLHGFVNSLLLAIALCRFALYLLTGNRRHLIIPLFSLIWWIMLATRGTFLFTLVECMILLLRLRRIQSKTINRIAVGALLVVLLFGWLGDLRSGADRFRELAQPASSYPQWLPSGVLWIYIYATTPLNNLAYSMVSRRPEGNPLLPHTLSLLLPTVVRNYIYGNASDAAAEITGDLIEANFNVSTAYLGPAQDFGLPAIFLFSLIAASACQWFWYKPDLRSQLCFAVFAMCVIFSLFYNLFLSLPIIAQLGWFFLIFRKERTRSVGTRQVHNLLVSSATARTP